MEVWDRYEQYCSVGDIKMIQRQYVCILLCMSSNQVYTVEPLNNETFGTANFFHYSGFH